MIAIFLFPTINPYTFFTVSHSQSKPITGLIGSISSIWFRIASIHVLIADTFESTDTLISSSEISHTGTVSSLSKSCTNNVFRLSFVACNVGIVFWKYSLSPDGLSVKNNSGGHCP